MKFPDTETRDEKIKQLYLEEEWPMQKIGEEMDLTRQRIHQILRDQEVQGRYNVDYSVGNRYSREECIEKLQEFYNQHKRPPLTDEWEGPPSSTTISTKFGSWYQALIEAGIYSRYYYENTKYTDEELVEYLQQAADKLDRAPPSAKIDELDSYPSATTYIKRFGTWSDALEAAGLDPNKRGNNRNKKYSDTMILRKLGAVIQDLGEFPTIRQWNQSYGPPSSSTICTRFDSWTLACHKAVELVEESSNT